MGFGRCWAEERDNGWGGDQLVRLLASKVLVIAKPVGSYRGDTPGSMNMRGREEAAEVGGWSLALEAENSWCCLDILSVGIAQPVSS